jgi:hypothetical protein
MSIRRLDGLRDQHLPQRAEFRGGLDMRQLTVLGRHPCSKFIGAFWLAVATAAGSDARAEPTHGDLPRTAVHCGHLLDTQGGKLLGETTVIIEGKRFASVLDGHQVPSGVTFDAYQN